MRLSVVHYSSTRIQRILKKRTQIAVWYHPKKVIKQFHDWHGKNKLSNLSLSFVWLLHYFCHFLIQKIGFIPMLFIAYSKEFPPISPSCFFLDYDYGFLIKPRSWLWYSVKDLSILHENNFTKIHVPPHFPSFCGIWQTFEEPKKFLKTMKNNFQLGTNLLIHQKLHYIRSLISTQLNNLSASILVLLNSTVTWKILFECFTDSLNVQIIC